MRTSPIASTAGLVGPCCRSWCTRAPLPITTLLLSRCDYTLARAGMSARHPAGVRPRRLLAADHPRVKRFAPSRVQEFRPIRALVELMADWIARFVAVQGVDRAMAIGAQAYTALF